MTKTGYLPASADAGFFLSSFCGCMTSPGNTDYIGVRTRNISFSGYTDIPSETVRIWALDPRTNQWFEIGRAITDKKPNAYGEGYWYTWQFNGLVPSECWVRKPGDRWSNAKIKATHAEGNLAAFEKGCDRDWSIRNYPCALDAYMNHGSGTSITIYGL